MNSEIYRQNIAAYRALYMLFLGCSNLSMEPIVPFVELHDLVSAPDKLVRKGYYLRMDADLWRDFERPSHPDEPTLSVSVTVIEMNERSIEALEVDYVWVIQGRTVRSPSFSTEVRPTPDYMIGRIARDGPRWACGSRVDVVVGVTMPGNDLSLIKSTNRRIVCPV